MIYVFKNRFYCTDIFKHLYDEMKKRGYDVTRITDENYDDSRKYVDALKGEKTVLITADHVKDDMDYYGKKAYSVDQCIQILKPETVFFGMHDLGIATVDDDVTGFEILMPDDSWAELFEKKNCRKLHSVGHPKHFGMRQDVAYETVFFVSSVYVYAKIPMEKFKDAFPLMFEHKIPFKFPKFILSNELIDYVRSSGIEVIDPEVESFDLLLQTRTAISNANSSIAVEAAMAGCKSINIGWDFAPRSIYEKYPITSVNDHGGLKEEHLHDKSHIPSAMESTKFKTNLAIDIITGAST